MQARLPRWVLSITELTLEELGSGHHAVYLSPPWDSTDPLRTLGDALRLPLNTLVAPQGFLLIDTVTMVIPQVNWPS